MRTLRRGSLVLLLVAAAFAGGAMWGPRGVPASAAADREALLYACPMHPQYTSDRPADCPACGMRLEPVRGGARTQALALSDGTALPAGAVRVSPERQQTIGVRLGAVETVAGTRSLRTTGRVVPDENAVYPLVAGSEGLVREMRGATTGALVRKNEVLLSFYAPDFVAAQQSYYAGLDTAGRVAYQHLEGYNQNRVADSIERYANELRNLGVSEKQLAEIATTRRLAQNLQVVSPVDGFVLARNASVGLRFDRGFEFYRIADLRRVWILADVDEAQAPFIRPGAPARAAAGDRRRAFTARVSRTEPIFDEATRTLKVRLEADNPGLALKPGMFVDVQFDVSLPETLAVPADAIVDSGLRKTVFVDRGEGFFEPRAVQTGWRLSDQVEVRKGLMPGERIVISGTFLIDSESRMAAATRGVYGTPAIDPVCGMEVDEKKAAAAGRTVEHEGTTYYFCADGCVAKFKADPAKYLEKAHGHDHGDDGTAHAHAEPAAKAPAAGVPAARPAMKQPGMPAGSRMKPGAAPKGGDGMAAAGTATVKDLVCGMDVDPAEAASAGLTSEHEGATYYFCNERCKTRFDAEPSKFVAKK